eukprot:6211311-Pleurochrysis_carterae.AAC.1
MRAHGCKRACEQASHALVSARAHGFARLPARAYASGHFPTLYVTLRPHLHTARMRQAQRTVERVPALMSFSHARIPWTRMDVRG